MSLPASPPGASSRTSSGSGAAPVFLEELSRLVAPSRISTRYNELATYSRDLCPRSLIRIAAGESPATLPEVVVWPETTVEIQAIVRMCAARGIPLVPYGAGSGVARGIEPSSGIVLDLKRMRRVLAIDEPSGAVSFQPGILGWHLEEQLNRRGLSLGHFPSSIMCSTAGGWLATRSAGQCSSKYGKIEDLVRELEVVLGDGTLVRARTDSRDFAQLFVGSEGSLGIITRATCTARPLPAARRMRGFWFPQIEAGCRAMQRLLECGLRPSVIRLYDEIDTLLSGSSRKDKSGFDFAGLPGLGVVLQSLGISERPDIDDLIRVVRGDAQRVRGHVERWLVKNLLGRPQAVGRLLDAALARFGIGCMLILGFEGEPAIVELEEKDARNQLAMLGARDLGAEPGEHWLRHRYDVSFKLSRAFSAGAYADTIEVASTWDRLLPLYRAVREALLPHALVMAHFSHAYPDGCSIYFSVLGKRRSASTLGSIERRAALVEDLERYDALWESALSAAVSAGATISHHHGTGRLKRRHLPAEHGASFAILSALKTACDPHGLMNPGSLLDPPKSGGRGLELPSVNDRNPKPPARVGPIRENDLVCDAPANVRLFELEAALRKSGRTLGGLPPAAYLRTLGEALSEPRPLEACLDAQRFVDRRLRLFATLPSGQPIVAPSKIAPRRATGPDLGHALLGQTAVGVITGATLRLLPQLPSHFSAYLFADADAAVRALYTARMLHGGVALSEILLMSRELCAVLLGSSELERFAYAVVCRTACPPALSDAIHALCAERLSNGRIGLLAEEKARALWEVPELSEVGVGAAAFKFPTVENLYFGPPAPLAAALAEKNVQQGRVLVGGVTLHRVALCTDEPVAGLSEIAAADGAVSAEAYVGPRLGDLLRSPTGKGARD